MPKGVRVQVPSIARVNKKNMSGKITKKLDKKIDKLTNQWKITISKESVEEEIENQLKKIQARVHVDGFRTGKAPIDVIDKKYGEDALYRAINTLIRNSINEIVKDENYKLAMQPEVSIKSELKRGIDIVITAKCVIKPNIPEIKYDKIEVDTYELNLSEEDKKNEIENFRNKMAKQKLVEGVKAVENGDMVDIDFVGKTAKDGVEFQGGNAKGYKLEIGSHSFIEGFEEQIIGHKKGDHFDINVKFPKDYHASNLAGQETIFSITINEVYTRDLPELNDEFAKALGFEGFDKIKELLFSNLKNIYETNAKQLIKDEVFNALIEKNKVDLPESIIEKEIEDRLESEKEKNKDNKKWNEKDAKKKIEDGIRKSYSSFYLTDGIAEKNAIEVSDDEIKQIASQDAIRNGLDVKEVLSKIEKDEKTKNFIYFTIKEAKVFDFIYEQIKKNVKKLDKKGFEKMLEEERKKLHEKNK